MSELNALLAQTDATKAQLDAARPLNNAQLQLALDIEYTHESNRIEGNTLTLRETDLVVNKGLTIGGKSMREHLEALNHYEAIFYTRDLATRPASLDEREVRNIHAFVLRGIDRGNAGRYRLVPVMISCSRHLPPQLWALSKLMGDYGHWLLGVCVAEARRLFAIHPFIDGNGRAARLAMNLILLSHGYPIANTPGDTDSRRSDYSALEKTNLESNDEGFLMLTAQHALNAARTLLERLGAAL